MMGSLSLQDLCARGQAALAHTDYFNAERALVQAEAMALASHDFETLARLYLPLQEARRQRRQRAGEGVVRLDLFDPPFSPEQLVERYPHGQLLVATQTSIDLALRTRTLAYDRGLFLDILLGATYSIHDSLVVLVIPDARVALPASAPSLDQLLRQAPPHTIVLNRDDLPAGEQRGSDQTYALTMSLFERLHQPALAQALSCTDPLQRIMQLREVIEIDYACEIAHQAISSAARQLALG
jgi:hypothetical protein